jgi:hypothetical protein
MRATGTPASTGACICGAFPFRQGLSGPVTDAGHSTSDGHKRHAHEDLPEHACPPLATRPGAGDGQGPAQAHRVRMQEVSMQEVSMQEVSMHEVSMPEVMRS